ncbi:MAG: endonuclease III, partial [Candidatus Cloacimonetes bacterium]|nr:endonuclease III [Candidatus Cloacimonadota bacterium]
MPNIDIIYSALEKEFTRFVPPVVDQIEEQTRDPFKILVTTILSARTKDSTTTAAVKVLFATVTNPDDLEKYTVEEIEELIYPVGFFHNKARQLKELPRVLKKEFQGRIPSEIEELVRLPGVGRKTANLVRA